MSEFSTPPDELKYLVVIDGRESWLPIEEAQAVYTREFAEIGGFVLGTAGTAREIRPAELATILSPEPITGLEKLAVLSDTE